MSKQSARPVVAARQKDEFVFVLSGRPTLVTNAGETELRPGGKWQFQHKDGTPY